MSKTRLLLITTFVELCSYCDILNEMDPKKIRIMRNKWHVHSAFHLWKIRITNTKLQQQNIPWKYSVLAEDKVSWGKTSDVLSETGSHPTSHILNLPKLQAYDWKIVFKVCYMIYRLQCPVCRCKVLTVTTYILSLTFPFRVIKKQNPPKTQ